MAGDESPQVAREKMAILRILANSARATGSKVIARLLAQAYGIELSERAVRYHLGLLDESGLTSKVSRRSGRTLTQRGLDELSNAMVADKVGFVIDRIELLAYETSFDPAKKSGLLPVNFSLFPRDKFQEALEVMAPVFSSGLCTSELVARVEPGQRLSGLAVPEGWVGLATVCSVVINGVLLKEGLPMDSRFGGILQMQQGQPWRFTELIQYAGSSLDPSEIFITSGMTGIRQAVATGDGKILANFREVPAAGLPLVQKAISRLKAAGIAGPLVLGEPGRPVCEVPVGLNKVGLVLIGGLNPVAAAVEAGIPVQSKAMSRVIDVRELTSFRDIS